MQSDHVILGTNCRVGVTNLQHVLVPTWLIKQAIRRWL